MSMPNDPIILLSYVNTKLRDYYSTLDEFVKSEDINKTQLLEKLKSVGYEYNEKRNCFE